MLEDNPTLKDHPHPDDGPDVEVLYERFQSPVQVILELADVKSPKEVDFPYARRQLF